MNVMGTENSRASYKQRKMNIIRNKKRMGGGEVV